MMMGERDLKESTKCEGKSGIGTIMEEIFKGLSENLQRS